LAAAKASVWRRRFGLAGVQGQWKESRADQESVGVNESANE
jgi:hypothetical protein